MFIVRIRVFVSSCVFWSWAAVLKPRPLTSCLCYVSLLCLSFPVYEVGLSLIFTYCEMVNKETALEGVAGEGDLKTSLTWRAKKECFRWV